MPVPDPRMTRSPDDDADSSADFYTGPEQQVDRPSAEPHAPTVVPSVTIESPRSGTRTASSSELLGRIDGKIKSIEATIKQQGQTASASFRKLDQLPSAIDARIETISQEIAKHPKPTNLVPFVLGLIVICGLSFVMLASMIANKPVDRSSDTALLFEQLKKTLDVKAVEQRSEIDKLNASFDKQFGTYAKTPATIDEIKKIIEAAIPKGDKRPTAFELDNTQVQQIANKIRENLPMQAKGGFDEARVKKVIDDALQALKLAKMDDITKAIAAQPKPLDVKAIAEAVKASLKGTTGSPTEVGADKPMDVFVIVTRSKEMPSHEYAKTFLELLQTYSGLRKKESPVRLGLYLAPQKLSEAVKPGAADLPQDLNMRLEQSPQANDVEELTRTGTELRKNLDELRPARHGIIVASVEAKAPEPEDASWKAFPTVDVVLVQPTSTASARDINGWLAFVSARKGRLTLIAPTGSGPTKDSINPRLYQALVQSIETVRRGSP